MAELADALDLGSSVPDVQVQVLLPAPVKNRIDMRFFDALIIAKTTLKTTFLFL